MIICCYTEINHHWSDQELSNKLVLLPEKLRQQALRKRQWIDQQLSIQGKLLLLHLMNELGINPVLSDLMYTDYHRPYFDNGLDFNIAHSGNTVICCGSDNGRIGIDVEEVKEIDLDDYTDYFTPNEWGNINRHPNKFDGFYDFWTRKEAILKAIGTGFHTPLSTVDISDENLTYDDVTYYLKRIEINGDYKCHIATTYIPADIRLIHVED